MGELGDLLERTVREWKQKEVVITEEELTAEARLADWTREYICLITNWPTSSCVIGDDLKRRKDELAEAILCYMDKMGFTEIQTESYVLCRDYTKKPTRLRAAKVFRVSL
jgi:hypothetical protein